MSEEKILSQGRVKADFEAVRDNLVGPTYGPILETHYRKAVAYIAQAGHPSISSIQRELRIGYNSAITLFHLLEERGAIRSVGAYDGYHVNGISYKKYDYINERNFFSPEFIEKQRNREIQSSVESAIKATLSQHFVRANVNVRDQTKLVENLTSAVMRKISMHLDIFDVAPAGQASSLEDLQSDSTANRPLPRTAPETYLGLRGPETPPEFVRRVYGRWLGQIDRADIRHLDPVLSQAINNWTRRNEWPSDVPLPTRGQGTRELIAEGPDVVNAHLGKFTGAEAVREAARLASAARRGK